MVAHWGVVLADGAGVRELRAGDVRAGDLRLERAGSCGAEPATLSYFSARFLALATRLDGVGRRRDD